ncbi:MULTISPECIES: enoyl-CoA hydratase/isomerase family protein [Halomonadaceae]|uniref:enoyl-CoA hydratase/isomerase family protein n=1 Tax=Halomonadaceae TaxID=28256 RepID=UPI00159B20DA|nr:MULTISPECIES: enoyl-CoA hydratase/isomerase family protein [Halomonas]QJQ94440.1 enoyl-CoA hydratase/isomerase family protein [Halomonas sp. PA5]
MPELAVRFNELPTQDDHRIGVATLNAPASLNALSLEMIEQLAERLEAWEGDPQVVAVWLEGAGGKAFCAGGDIVALYRSITAGGDDMSEARAFAEAYFSAEYALDYRIHTYSKPLLVWADGIVMGGGMGLMAGAGYRLVTESSRLAMPEISIGLYPDIGASWFLSRMPPGVGAYLGLTGAQLNARDALDLGLADRLIPRERHADLQQALADADYGRGLPSDAHRAVSRVLDEVEVREQAPSAQLWPYLDHLQALTAGTDVADACRRILDDSRDESWLAANRARLAAGCPLSAHLVWRMLERHRHGSLVETFREELSLSVRCCTEGDLAEGVRALLIDKDKQPHWSHVDVESVPAGDVTALLAPLWPADSHPLRGLGNKDGSYP